MDAADDGKVVVVFRVVVKPEMDEIYERRLAEVVELASQTPGLLSFTGYEGPGREKVYLIEWDSEESLQQWRAHPVHVEAMADGRDRLFEWYKVQICREYRVLGSAADAP